MFIIRNSICDSQLKFARKMMKYLAKLYPNKIVVPENGFFYIIMVVFCKIIW